MPRNPVESMGATGLQSAGKRTTDSSAEATDQKARGSNPLRRAKKKARNREDSGLFYNFLSVFKCGSNRLTHILTHTGKCLETNG